MPRMRRTILLLVMFVATSAPAQEHVWPTGARAPQRHPQLEPVAYSLEIESSYRHLLRVHVTVDGFAPDRPLDVAMPAWTPGAYHLTVPAKNVLRLGATDAKGQVLGVTQLDRQTWRVENPPSGPVTVSYSVYTPRASVVASHVSREYAGITGFDTFVYVVGNLTTPCTLRVKERPGWTVATGLPDDDAAPPELRGHAFFARDYDVLVDSPLLWGKLATRSFEVGGKPHHLVWSGTNDFDIDRIASDTQRIVEAVAPMFGSAALPYESYWFLWRFQDGGGGGLEHLNSTRINDGPKGYGDPDQLDRHWRVTAHEFVHTWNIKRIRPKPLGPFDYTREQHTTYLWFGEGFTSYLGDLALLRAGIWTKDRYLRSLAAMIQGVRDTPAARFVSAQEASFRTWHKAQNGSQGGVNYYSKGLLIALMMDLEIRKRTGNTRELTDLMAALYDDFRKTGAWFEDGAIRKAAEALTGDDWSAFFDEYVAGTRKLRYDEALRAAGLKLELKPGRDVASLGVKTKGDAEARLVDVLRGSAAAKAGLKVGDVIVAVDGARVTSASLAGVIAKRKPKTTAELLLFRDDQALTRIVTMGTRRIVEEPSVRPSFRDVRWRLADLKRTTDLQRATRARWLRTTGKTPQPAKESRATRPSSAR